MFPPSVGLVSPGKQGDDRFLIDRENILKSTVFGPPPRVWRFQPEEKYDDRCFADSQPSPPVERAKRREGEKGRIK